MRYRRTRQPGGTYFFTVNLADRSSSLLTDRVDDLRKTVRTVRRNHPFDILAWVVMSEHLHAVWSLPDNDADCATRWMLIKAGFSRNVPKGERVRASRLSKGERGVWQRRFWEHLITDEDDLARHVDYVHINPVKHGHVARAVDWPYSSIHGYIRRGWLPEDWAAATDDALDTGER
jgi:putative transposase